MRGLRALFLWIPPTCEKLRGVVLAQHNMEEESILENPKFRQALSELGFAEIWCAPAFDHLFRFNQGAGDTFLGMTEDLAEKSGYEELKWAPIVGIGHSAAASWPYYFAVWKPERTLAAISVSGQWPYFRDRNFAPDIWGDRTLDFIPCLESMGEYEAANSWSKEGLQERQQHPRMALSMLANPAQGHFASSDRKAEYLALYIKKAAQYRLPDRSPTNGPPVLKPIDPDENRLAGRQVAVESIANRIDSPNRSVHRRSETGLLVLRRGISESDRRLSGGLSRIETTTGWLRARRRNGAAAKRTLASESEI